MVESDFFPIYIYLGIVALVTLMTLAVTAIVPSVKSSPIKFMPYESGIKTETHLLQERFPLRHYLVALIFLVFDIEVIFLYPWAVIGKTHSVLSPFMKWPFSWCAFGRFCLCLAQRRFAMGMNQKEKTPFFSTLED